jgi:hypothetical protein
MPAWQEHLYRERRNPHDLATRRNHDRVGTSAVAPTRTSIRDTGGRTPAIDAVKATARWVPSMRHAIRYQDRHRQEQLASDGGETDSFSSRSVRCSKRPTCWHQGSNQDSAMTMALSVSVTVPRGSPYLATNTDIPVAARVRTDSTVLFAVLS